MLQTLSVVFLQVDATDVALQLADQRRTLIGTATSHMAAAKGRTLLSLVFNAWLRVVATAREQHTRGAAGAAVAEVRNRHLLLQAFLHWRLYINERRARRAGAPAQAEAEEARRGMELAVDLAQSALALAQQEMALGGQAAAARPAADWLQGQRSALEQQQRHLQQVRARNVDSSCWCVPVDAT